jgi:hypothetical protein
MGSHVSHHISLETLDCLHVYKAGSRKKTSWHSVTVKASILVEFDFRSSNLFFFFGDVSLFSWTLILEAACFSETYHELFCCQASIDFLTLTKVASGVTVVLKIPSGLLMLLFIQNGQSIQQSSDIS